MHLNGLESERHNSTLQALINRVVESTGKGIGEDQNILRKKIWFRSYIRLKMNI